MEPCIIPGLIVLVLIIIIFIISVPAFKLKQEEYKRTGKHPKGHYLGQGIAIGIPLGIPVGLAMGNIALGPAIGIAIGAALGTAMEKKHEKELRPLTEAELKMKRRSVMAGSITMVLGVITLLAVLFFCR